MFDLKTINSVVEELGRERGIPKEKLIEAIEQALATAYKKEYGKRGQMVRTRFYPDTGLVAFEQIKLVVDETRVKMPQEREAESLAKEEEAALAGGAALSSENDALGTDREGGGKGKEGVEGEGEVDDRVNYNPEHHILIEDARKIKRDVSLDEEIVFPLETKESYGRIAAQTAKQVIIQKIREAERESVLEEFGGKRGEIVSGMVQRMERGSTYVDLGRTTGILPYDEQIPGERYRPGERIRAYLYAVEETPRGVFLRLSRSHPQFLVKLFEVEAPEVANGTVEIKAIAREPGSRSKIAVFSNDEHVDPVGSLVGQRGVRVSTVMSELGGEKIDIIEWSADQAHFVEDALSPARAIGVSIDEETRQAVVEVAPDQQSLAIGRGGQNVRLAAKLTGWKIDIRSARGGEEDVPTEGETGIPTEEAAVPSGKEEGTET